MKTNHLISLLQNDYTTLKVSFSGSGGGQRYTYKVPLNAAVNVDDYVVVATDDLSLSIGLVVAVDDFPDIDTSLGVTYKWIVQKIDLKAYLHQLDVETRFGKHLKQLQRTQAKTQTLQAFANQFAEGSAQRNELDALISGATTIEALVDLSDNPPATPPDSPEKDEPSNGDTPLP